MPGALPSARSSAGTTAPDRVSSGFTSQPLVSAMTSNSIRRKALAASDLAKEMRSSSSTVRITPNAGSAPSSGSEEGMADAGRLAAAACRCASAKSG